jgi:BlaI family transcriptional regulator, penicillinase repressor
MPRRTTNHPTEAELEILTVLWRRGPSTVRQVHEILQADRSTTLTTTLKLLQTMTAKGITTRGDGRPQLFSAAVPEERTQAGLVRDLVHRAFAGSVGKLVMRAVEESDLSDAEVRKIHNLIGRYRRTKRGGQ